MSWLRRHRVLGAFLGGAVLTLLALGAAGYWVLSDQRRSARALAAALSRSLAREVRIDRVTDLAPDRVVMRGVTLPQSGGWPVTIAADRVETAGPLLAAARGDPAPVRVTVVGPTVDLPAATGGGGGDVAATLAGLREGVRGLLTSPMLFDVTLTGGRMRGPAGGTEFELSLLKGAREAKGTLTVRDAAGPPLAFTVDARLDGDTARLAVTGRGPLAPVVAWLPAPAAALRDRPLDLQLDADLRSADALARLRLALGDAVDAGATVTAKADTVEVAVPRATADLSVVTAVAGVGWQPTGRVEIADLAATWKPAGARLPSVRATVRVPTVSVAGPAAPVDLTVERLEATVALDPATGESIVAGQGRAARLRTPRVEAAPVRLEYRVVLDPQGGVSRVELASLGLGADGARLQGQARYEVKSGLLDGRLEGEDEPAEALVRRLLPGWLDPADRLRVTGLRLTVTGLEPRSLQRGSTRLEARGFRWTRRTGQLAGERLRAHTEFAPAGATTDVTAERVASTLPVLPGQLPRLALTATLERTADGGFRPARAALSARDAGGADMVVATLAPTGRPDRFRLSARVPALDRIGGLWPDVSRRLTGSLRLDVELGDGFGTADGRLALDVPEGELWDGKIALRDVQADVPIRRGAETAGEPPWGTLKLGEVIAYGVIVQDLTTPARVWRDRLSLSRLGYVLYSGGGEGWTEVEWQAAGPTARGKLTGERVRVEDFMSAYGIRGGTMTGLLRYELDYQYRDGRLGLNGRFEVPEGGTVNIQLLERLLSHAEADPTGIVRRALENLRAFDYKDAAAEVRSAGDDIRVSLALRGRERFMIFPPRVKEINVRNMPLSFLARQFPGT